MELIILKTDSEILHLDAHTVTHIPVPARRSVSAESSVVPGTVPHLCLGVDVEEGTLLVVARI